MAYVDGIPSLIVTLRNGTHAYCHSQCEAGACSSFSMALPFSVRRTICSWKADISLSTTHDNNGNSIMIASLPTNNSGQPARSHFGVDENGEQDSGCDDGDGVDGNSDHKNDCNDHSDEEKKIISMIMPMTMTMMMMKMMNMNMNDEYEWVDAA